MGQENIVVKLEEKNKLDTVSVWELMGNNFYVPDYQRGYRWTKTEVIKLLADLREYIESYNESEKKSFYCLQPLVVYFNRKKDAWEVIDGQQRLTTLFLLLNSQNSVLRDIKEDHDVDIFKLTYSGRTDCETFLNSQGSENENSIQHFIRLLSKRSSKDIKIETKDFPIQIENIDYYHICNALSAISNYIKGSQNFNYRDFIYSVINVMNQKNRPIVKFIWYDVTSEIEEGKINSEEVFSRLNVGKINLTNAELIKALFLNRVDIEAEENLKKISNNKIEDIGKLKIQITEPLKTKIAADWDMIEHSLSEPDFWAFIYGKDDNYYDTRIEFLFDLIKGKKRDDEEYYTFDKYVSEFKSNDPEGASGDNSILGKWKQITDCYFLYKNWYEDRQLYHLIGFLRYKKVNIETITKIQSSANTNSDFVKKLRRLCVKYALFDKKELKALENNSAENESIDKNFDQFVKDRLSDLTYDEVNKEQIESTLLLFNVLSSIDCEKDSSRFSFVDYYNEKWDIEHVRSQTDKKLSGTDRVDWILTNLGYFSGVFFPFESVERTGKEQIINKMVQEIEENLGELKKEKIMNSCKKYPNGVSAGEIVEGLIELLKDRKEIIEIETSTVYKMIRDGVFGEKSNPLFNKHSISNLVLLDQGTNRGYKNAFFPVKRQWIYSREKSGVYILPCTRNVFSKVYSHKLIDLMNWSQDDATRYMEEIEKCLTNI